MRIANADRRLRHLIGAALAVASAPAAAQEFCPERPGLTDEPCTVGAGRVLVELGAIDWTLDRSEGRRVDTVLLGDLLVRVGLSERLEAQIGWTSFGTVRVRDAAGVHERSSSGDVLVAVKANIADKEGGLSLSVAPYATLPVGGSPIGAGTWGAGLVLPMSYHVAEGVAFDLTPEIDAEPNESGSGRHLAYGAAAGIGIDLSEVVTLSVETQLIRDEDPGRHSTQGLAQATLAWVVGGNTQVDAGVAVGLNRDSPDLQVQIGLSRGF